MSTRTASLGLGPHPVIGFIHRQAIADAGQRSPSDLYWSVIFVVVFFAIHVGRLDAEWTMLGMLSPAVATPGRVIVSLVLSIIVIYPLDLALQRADATGRAAGLAAHAARHVA